jgi:kynurenine formamidase
MRTGKTILGALLAATALALAAYLRPAGQEKSDLAQAWQILHRKRFVDLTHAFAPGIPHWKGFPDEQRDLLFWYDPNIGSMGDGFFAQRYSLVGQWGTHVDPPAHFAKGLRTVDQIDVKEMILPLVVIDVHDRVAQNPDYTLTVDDVKAWEAKHGPVPEGAFVAMRTDWSKRWPDMAAMENKDAQGVAHYPGWSLPALRYLYEERRITASGHETTDTDPGLATTKDDYTLETYILKRNHYQIELLTDLDRVPEAGALVVAAFPKPKGGSGFPARVFAILP